MIALYGHFDEFRPDALGSRASAVGLDAAAFDAERERGETREALVRIEQEGIRNKVSVTPTFFVNGRKYVYEMDLPTLIDVLLEEFERLQGAGGTPP